MDPLIRKLHKRFSLKHSKLLAKRINQVAREQWKEWELNRVEASRRCGGHAWETRLAGLKNERDIEQLDPSIADRPHFIW